ncbi:hypothetical protein [Tropicimonas sp.]|uniref:hypothetical protein n=1 Tax=Tropicimonas sp. TaxID=2067044 RepID=UPI003A879BE6
MNGVKGRASPLSESVLAAALPAYNMDDAALRGLLDLVASRGLGGVIVHSRDVGFAAGRLAGSPIQVIAAISYPSGANSRIARQEEMAGAIAAGADALAVVAPMGNWRDGRREIFGQILEDAVAGAGGRPLHLILETCLIGDGELDALLAAIGPKISGLIATTGFEGSDAGPDIARENARLTSRDARAIAWSDPATASGGGKRHVIGVAGSDELERCLAQIAG